MRWTTQPTMAVDLETTGVDPLEDRILTAAVVMFAPKVAEPRVRTWLVNPGEDVEISDEVIAIHGVTREDVDRAGRTPRECLEEIVGLLVWSLGRDIPVVAFNGAFDLTMVEAECRRHGVLSLEDRLGVDGVRPVIDPYVLDCQTFRKMDDVGDGDEASRLCPCGCGATRKTLSMACLHYGVELSQAHDAAADAIAADALWRAIVAKNPGRFGRHSLTALHKAQITWRREHMDYRRERFDAEGRAHDGFDPNWPLRRPPMPEPLTELRGRSVATIEPQGALL
jgi:DNA polymerase-3 subunit epsilon